MTRYNNIVVHVKAPKKERNANDVDPHMVTLGRPNSYIERSSRIGENLQHLHRQIQCSRILSSCQSRATPDMKQM